MHGILCRFYLDPWQSLGVPLHLLLQSRSGKSRPITRSRGWLADHHDVGTVQETSHLLLRHGVSVVRAMDGPVPSPGGRHDQVQAVARISRWPSGTYGVYSVQSLIVNRQSSIVNRHVHVIHDVQSRKIVLQSRKAQKSGATRDYVNPISYTGG